MNYMIKEEWTCPPSFIENVKPCAGSNTFSLKDDLESSTVASSLSSSCQDTHEPLTTKSSSGSINKNSNVQVTPKVSCHVENSEEFIRQKYEEDRECLKEAYNFLKQIAKHLMRGQAIVNTAMVYFLKYTRIHSVSQINKYLVASACFLLAAKCKDEPVRIEYLVEWYIFLETKRTSNNSKTDFSTSKKYDYSNRIQEQEFDILCEIGFDCETDLPNKYIAQFAASPLGKTIFTKSDFSKYAYMFANDSFMTTCALYYPAQHIAAAAIYMAIIYISTSGSNSAQNKAETSSFDTNEWYKTIDETLDLATIIEVKDEIKKCYAKKASSS